MKLKYKEVFYILSLVIAFLIIIWFIWFFNSEGKACISNPLVYGAKKMGNVECNCFQYQEDKAVGFRFNDSYVGLSDGGR